MRLVGLYTIEAGTGERLRKDGYSKFSAQVSLKADGTFEVRDMPECWNGVFPVIIDGPDAQGTGYDTCFGRWQINKTDSVYYVELRIDRFSSDSAFAKGARYKSFSPDMPWLIGIADITKERSAYALAVPLNHGDGGNLFFTRKTD